MNVNSTKASSSSAEGVSPPAEVDDSSVDANGDEWMVERSVTGRRWRLRSVDERTTLAIRQRADLAEPLARILAARDVALDSIEEYLEPRLRTSLVDPDLIKDMPVGAERLAQAIRSGESVALLADYDVDGATSAAVLYRFLASVGHPPLVYVPDRRAEGYGPNVAALTKLRNAGVSLVITLDCGTSSFDPLAAAAEMGLDVIVVDHHRAPLDLPKAVAVINPTRIDNDVALSHLAAVGVAFFLVMATNRRLRLNGWYGARPEPDLRQWLDLLALGTVCDMVPLVGVNRAFVGQGLKVMARRGNVGLAALADEAGLRASPSAFDLGFALGPRVNAGGRVGESALGARLLSTDDRVLAADLARRLGDHNRQRQRIEREVLEEALVRLDRDEGAETGLTWVAGENWHPGVVGIVASQLVERTHNPTVVLAVEGDRATGSCRSVPGVDIGSIINAASAAGLLVKGGGHAMAAGLTVERGRMDDVRRFIAQSCRQQVGNGGIAPTLLLDAQMPLTAISPGFIADLDRLGPFGSGNPEPCFAFPDVQIRRANIFGERHLRCEVTDASGARVTALAFRAVGTPLGETLLNACGQSWLFAARCSMRDWRGSYSIILEDIAGYR